MARTVVRVEGYQEMLRRLREMKASAAGTRLLKSVMPGARIVRDAAAANAPRSQQPRKVGHLGDHIIIKVKKRSKTRAEVLVGPDADHFWGHFLEYGTSKMPAQPWLRPSLDNNAAQTVGVIGVELRSRILEAIR